MRFLFAALLLVSTTGACQPLPIPAPPAPPDGMVACDTTVVPQQENNCDGLFVQGGNVFYSCYTCPVTVACLDVTDQVYCTPGDCLKAGCAAPPVDDAVSMKRAQKARERVSKRVRKKR